MLALLHRLDLTRLSIPVLLDHYLLTGVVVVLIKQSTPSFIIQLSNPSLDSAVSQKVGLISSLRYLHYRHQGYDLF